MNTILSPSNQPTARKTFFCRGGCLLGLCALAVITSGCTPSVPAPPPEDKIENSVSLDASVKEVWESVSRSAAENSWPLGRVHTAAGLITFDVNLWPAGDYVNCGLIKSKEWRGRKQRTVYKNWVEQWAHSLGARITLSVISEGRKARLTIGVRYTLRLVGGAIWTLGTNRYFSYGPYKVTCTPTHKLEEAFIDTVKENLQKQRSAKK